MNQRFPTRNSAAVTSARRDPIRPPAATPAPLSMYAVPQSTCRVTAPATDAHRVGQQCLPRARQLRRPS